MTLLYIPCKNSKEARRISSALLKERLIACSNMIPMQSMFSWKGKIENAKEVLIIAKTGKKSAKKAESLVKKLHSYDVPAIITIDSKANREFSKWAESVMK